jgi:hypothetical protein
MSIKRAKNMREQTHAPMFPKVFVATFVAVLLALANASPSPEPTPAPNPNMQLENRQVNSVVSVVTAGGT